MILILYQIVPPLSSVFSTIGLPTGADWDKINTSASVRKNAVILSKQNASKDLRPEPCGFTKTEVCEIGKLLNLPKDLVYKTPSDGLSGKTDEDKLGFSYAELDEFIRTGKKGKSFDIINKKHKLSEHKRLGTIKFTYKKQNHFDMED